MKDYTDEPLYYWYTTALAESLGGNEPTIYGLRLLEYLVCDRHTRPEIRSQAMTTIYYAIDSVYDYHMAKSTAEIVLQLSENDNELLANASLQLLGSINEEQDDLAGAVEDGWGNRASGIDQKANTTRVEEPINVVTAEDVLANIKPHFANQLESLSGHEFERFMKRIFERMGYKATMTPASNDYGADLILSKGNVKTAVQLKRYGEKQKVSSSAVGAIVGAMAHYDCSKSMVITTARFTRQAIKLAESNNVELWDWDKVRNVVTSNMTDKN